MGCRDCSRRLKSGLLIPAGYKQREDGNWHGPDGQVLIGDEVEERPTRTTLKLAKQVAARVLRR